ncbi:hypothetical protein MMSR116_27455 [Methylobacterium mesophilicum SR1.6/6]|uniref:Uncharacterized protein n=1 Tax=Methylobacterium mesophilicum SR1.6/6 TaxID=908290 RepID=A0A6B9FRK5_9HYPH|nr:hypothetical protein [Methylobacterium mesophilicum]QGY05220.1 hypothetical protein MMSR116_27455 [Methylobacterium mesophilicum SR1.6/6]
MLIAVRGGMDHADLAPLVGPSVGIFLDGSTEWKLARMADWGAFRREHSRLYYVARVITVSQGPSRTAPRRHSRRLSSRTSDVLRMRRTNGAQRVQSPSHGRGATKLLENEATSGTVRSAIDREPVHG